MRALLAAQSGADRKLHDIFQPIPGSCDGTGEDLSFTPFANLGCADVRVTCTAIQSPAGSGNFFYTITSVGRCGPAGDQAVRTVQVQAR